MTYATNHIVYYMQEAKLHFQTDQRHCDIESKKGMSVYTNV